MSAATITAAAAREFLPRELARQQLKIELEKCWAAHQKVDIAKQVNSDAGERARVPHAPSTLIRVTVGTGKTYGAAALAGEYTGVPVLYLVGTHELGNEFIAKYLEQGGNPGEIMLYLGRRDNEKSESHCHRMLDSESLSEKRRIQQPLLCRECAHGLKTQLSINQEYDTRESREKVIAIVEKSELLGFNLDKTKECSWIRHQLKAQRTRIVVAHYASFSSALAVFNFGMRSVSRLVVVDETAPLAEFLSLNLEDISQWNANLPKALEVAQARLDRAEVAHQASIGSENEKIARTNLNEARRLHQNCIDAEKLLPALIDWAASSAKQPGVTIFPPEEVLKFQNTSLETVQDSAAAWEWAQIDARTNQQFWELPLRATGPILWSMRADSAYAENGKIHCVAPTVLGEAVVNDRHQFVFLDATAPLFMRQIVEANKGAVVEVNAEQSLRLALYADTARHRKGIAKDQAQLDKFYNDVCAMRQLCANELCVGPRDIGVLTYRLVAEKMGSEKMGCGWWGAHERGTEMFESLDLLIVGEPRTGRGERQGYECERALALSAGVDRGLWPRGRWGGKPWYERLLERDGKCLSPLPQQPEIRGWLIDRLRQMFVQAVGRVRAVGAERPKTVWIAAATAGLVDWPGEVGVQPEWRASPSDLRHGRGRGEGSRAACSVNNILSAEAALNRLTDAALRALQAGEMPSKRTCAPAVSAATFARRWPGALAAAMRFVDAARLDELLAITDARFAVVRQAAVNEADRRIGERMFVDERLAERGAEVRDEQL